MGNFKTSNIKVYKQTKLISFSSLYVQNPKIKKSLFFLGFQINKRRNDKITYNQKKKESKDVPAVAVKLPTFMFLKKKKLFFHNQKKILKKIITNKKKKKEVLQISLDKKVV